MARTSTTWDSGSRWQHGETKTIRVPIALEIPVMDYARAIDSHNGGDISQRAGDIFLILQVIEKYIDYKRTNYHPNQNSRELDINTRAWDELRKFKKLLQENPEALGLTPGAN
ncbi:hypothetical protein [Nostoc sp. 106C]|uniref:hypothetical protein n=1 Tax=Nostoc sp. 106C TaxID=1932667 RepID=UPI000A3AC8FD|nr:hypothetical protein [Nostoc sp. 106C]OUL28789.1 hypothetical protein BV375_16865 [Nostoc sp. 106C]